MNALKNPGASLPVYHLYIFLTVVFTVYGQLILKHRIAGAGELPQGLAAKLCFLLTLFLDPWILSGFFSAFLAALCWMAAMTRFELSYAYPFMSLSFLLVLAFSVLFLEEPLTAWKLGGTVLVILGLVALTR